MRRRTILVGIAGGILLSPLTVGAQPAGRMRRIGILSPAPPPGPGNMDELDRLLIPLRRLGWVEGRNLAIEGRFANGKRELLRPYAEELVRLNVDVIYANGTEAAFAAKNATTAIPIVIGAGDPVASGLVSSFVHPGGNITGYSLRTPEIEAKRVSLLHELLPSARRSRC